MAASSSDGSSSSEEEMTLCVKWVGKEYVVRVCADDTVGELKRRICEVTNVLPKRQKLLNVKLGSKPADDSVLLSHLSLKPNLKIMMLGTVEDEILVEPVDSPEILDDFEFEDVDSLDIKDREVNKLKLRRRIEQYKIRVLNPPREAKKLVVLDIDYTLFDHRSPAENPHQLMRPYLHEFLAAAYSEYDIIIWSATSMKWVEVKMKELGVLNNPNYKITALLDHLGMISVQSQSHGVFDCKPLGLIWGKFPEKSSGFFGVSKMPSRLHLHCLSLENGTSKERRNKYSHRLVPVLLYLLPRTPPSLSGYLDALISSPSGHLEPWVLKSSLSVLSKQAVNATKESYERFTLFLIPGVYTGLGQISSSKVTFLR